MSVPKILALAGLLLTACLAAGGAAQAAEPEEARVFSVLQAVADAWNQGNTLPSASFEAALTIVDDTPPYLFQGPDAVADWIEAYRKDQPRSSDDSKTSLHFLPPRAIEINGARAYVAVPSEWAVEQDRRTNVLHGTVTVVLDRVGEDWRIATWVWTPR